MMTSNERKINQVGGSMRKDTGNYQFDSSQAEEVPRVVHLEGARGPRARYSANARLDQLRRAIYAATKSKLM